MKRFPFVIVSLALFAVLALTGGSLHFSAASALRDTSPSATAAPDGGMSQNAAAENTPEATAEPTAVPEPQVYNLSFIGDITPDSVAAYRGTAAAYQSVVTADDLGYVFALTKQYFEDDDFTMANFEAVYSDSALPARDKTFTFQAPTSYVGLLTAGSVDFVTLGNNHILDYGEDGCADTKATLEAAGIAYAGRDEYTLYTTDSGLIIGVYAVSFGTTDQVKAGVKALQDAGAEFIIAALHWGDEGSYTVNSDQITLGHAAIDAGADVVYGSHPHTLQPIEIYNDHYIFYSMGNWSFGGNTNPRDKDTFIARLEVTRASDGTISVTHLEIIPCASSGVEDGNNYQPVPYAEDDERYDRVLSKLDGSFSGANLSIGYTYTVNE